MSLDNEQKQHEEQEFYQLFLVWRHVQGDTSRRRFLEEYPRLVGPELNGFALSEAFRQDDGFKLLWQIRQRGGALQAIRDIFVDHYGGLVLDLPPWMEEVKDRYDDLYYDHPPQQTAAERTLLLYEAFQRGIDEQVAPEVLADLSNKLALALKEHPFLERSEAVEDVITLYKASLRIMRVERYPRQWAIHLTNLGTAYTYRDKGERWRNIEKALACFKAALRVYTLRDFPQQYAMIMLNLSKVYHHRIKGNEQENREQRLQCLLAVLRVRTRQASPAGHAAALYSLGLAYQQRLLGNRSLNKEKAIRCYHAALQLYVNMDQFTEQANVLNSLGDIYGERLLGNRVDNQQKAFQYFQQALTIYTQEDFPLQWAFIQVNLGELFAASLSGTRRDNLEEAITCYTNALQILYPEHINELVKVLINLGDVYLKRIMDDRRTNLEKAIDYLKQALQISPKEHSPLFYADIQNNLGGAYGELGQLPGKRLDHMEAAIQAYKEALQIYRQEENSVNDYAMILGNLGTAYITRIAGDQAENQKQAIRYIEISLQTYTMTDYPLEYASAQSNLGVAYWNSIVSHHPRTNLAQALNCFRKALHIYTLEGFPVEYRNTHLNIASLVYDKIIPAAQRTGKRRVLASACTFAQKHYAQARQAQLMLGWLESDEQGRASLQGFYPVMRNMYIREAWCLWLLGNLSEAALVLESGRVQALVEAQAIAGTVLSNVCREHATAFEAARQHFQRTRLEGDRGQKRVARDEFLDIRQAIQDHCQRDFLTDLTDYQEIASAAAEQALVYIAASNYGGFALLIPPACASPNNTDRRPLALPLPDLTREKVDEWIITHAQEEGVCGGYQFALRGQGLELLLLWLAANDDEELYERKMATPLNQIIDLLSDKTTSLALMIADTVSLLSQADEEQYDLKQALQSPLETWLNDEMLHELLQQCLSWNLQKREIAALLQELSVTIMEPLHAWLVGPDFAVHQSRLACIPCGHLGIFPLHAAPIGPDQLPFAESYEMTYQASARVLNASLQAAHALPPRGPILAVGGHLHAGKTQLPCTEGEVEGIVHLAKQAQYHESICLSGIRATKALFLKKLADIRQHPGAWLHIASHGHASVNNPHENYMELSGFDAQGQKARLSLATFQRERLLLGLWGVTASGCVTGLVDLEIAPDELGSFAAGLLQAGAVCVVATLWPVNDHATALLMLRFHQIRLSNAVPSAPVALREAVHWLRTATSEQLDTFARTWRLPLLSMTHPLRDVVRGIEETTRSERLLQEYSAIFASVESELHTNATLFPYHHPVYWASPILYGL